MRQTFRKLLDAVNSRTEKQISRSAARRRTRLGVEVLEDRVVPATLIALDFDGCTKVELEQAQAAFPGWGAAPVAEASAVDSLSNLNAMPGGYDRYRFLDVNLDGVINRLDGDTLAEQIMDGVRQRYAPYDVEVVRQDSSAQAITQLKNSGRGSAGRV